MKYFNEASQKNYLRIIYVTENHHQKAELLIRKYQDQDLSLVDAISFTVMKELNISQVFGFDSHFRLEGFKLVPG